LFELVAANINKGDIPKALEIAKTAFESEPNFEEARKIYAVAATYAGNSELAKQLTGLDVVPDDRFINAYVATGQYAKVIEIWKMRIAAEPNNPQYHIYLSATYLADKQRDKSIAELRKAAELNPAFKEQSESYIKEIKAGRNPK
jgi:tetratricopeptide (TPR) repeat protein